MLTKSNVYQYTPNDLKKQYNFQRVHVNLNRCSQCVHDVESLYWSRDIVFVFKTIRTRASNVI